jgi:hypothetical protein
MQGGVPFPIYEGLSIVTDASRLIQQDLIGQIKSHGLGSKAVAWEHTKKFCRGVAQKAYAR